MSGSTTVSIQNPPAIYNVIGGGSYCKNGAGLPVGISNSDIGINYTLKRGTTTVQTLAGTGSAFNFNNQTAAGTYTVTGNNGGCVAAMNGNAVITINPNPVAYNLTGGGSYCPPGVGLPVGLSNSRTGISYQLMDGASPVGTPVAGITGQALNFGNQAVFASYTVIATNASTFCTATMSGTAVVSDATPVAYTLTGGGSYCQNGSGLPVGVSNSDLGISYQLMMGANPIGSSVAGTGSAINFGNQTTAGTYSVIATNNSVFCTDTMNGNIVISIDPLPSAYNVTGGGSYCAGGAGVAVGLDNSDTGINYQLMLGGSPVGSAVAGTGSSISFGNQTAAGTYTVIASNASTSCSISMNGNATVVINSNPTPTITAGGPTTFCSGDSVTLTSSVASSYLWSTGATSQSIVVKLSGNKSVTVTDANGCQGTSASTLVSVSSAPIITASGPTTFCAGGSVTLTSSAASSYLWSNGATTQSIIVSSTQKDSVVVTNAIGCKDTSAATLVTVNPNPATPTITADGTLNFCSGDSVTLTSSIAFSYLWSTGETTRSIVVKFNDIDSVTAIDANGCQATSAPITVLVSSTPTITASGPTTLCSGGSVTLTSSAGSSYLWSNGATTQSIIVSSSERDSVVVTNGIGCKDTSAATIVTVNPNPATPTISAGGATTFCAGDSVTLTSSASSSYLWSTGATSQSIVVKVGGNKSVTISDANGCQNTSAATLITVNSNPSPSITADGPTSFCSGDSVTLTSSAASSYLWSTGATSQSIVVKITENDSVRVTDANGCEGTSAPTLVSVSSTPIITASGPTTFCSGGSVTLTSSSGSSYLWSNGATTQSIVVSSTQKDSVIVTNAIACQDTSAATQVTVNPCNFTWTGSSDTDWNTGSNWDIGFVPDNVDDAVIPSGVPNMPVLTGVAQIGDLTISSGATFTMSNGSTLNIFGNFTNSGTFTDNGGITSFDGSSAQSINGTTNFKNLSISNSAGLTLNNAVNVTGVLRLLQGSITTNDSLTLDLNTGTIAYDVTDAGNISGNLKISKSVLSISNHFVACPVTGTSVNDFNDDTQVINPSTGKSRLFTWNFATQAWSTGITNLNTALNPGTGYSLYFIAGTTLDFTGGYNHGAIFSPITASNANTNKYMLIGNPYPATLDWNAASGWTKTGVNNAIYFWDAQNSRYASYVNGTGSNGGTQYIPSLQAFLVMTDGTGGTASVIPNNLARVTGPNNSLWRGASSNNILRIKASSLGYSDETVLQFSDEATAYFDNNLDAIKMKNPEGSPSLYTSDFQNIYSINTMPLEDRIIPLNLEANFAGLHTLSFEGIESFDKAVSIVLEDKLLNTRTEVKPGLIYEVDVKQDDNSSRFNLRVGDTGAAEAMSIRIGSNEKNILVEFNSSASGNASLKVFNILGQEMASMNNIDAANGLVTVPAAFLKEGIYIVKIILNDKLYTGKVFIK
jgi:hypothetical protein